LSVRPSVGRSLPPFNAYNAHPIALSPWLQQLQINDESAAGSDLTKTHPRRQEKDKERKERIAALHG